VSAGLLRARELVVGYGHGVCQPVSFTLALGECLGLAGPNGAGKSTVLAALTGGARIFSGTLNLDPVVSVSLLEQHPPNLGECPLTGRDLLTACQALSRPLPDILAPLLKCRLDRLSGGQQQLLRVWACLGGEANLVLMDEPTNHLDPQTRQSLADLLHRGRQGRGVMLVSHDREFLVRVCDRVVEVMPEPGGPGSGAGRAS